MLCSVYLILSTRSLAICSRWLSRYYGATATDLSIQHAKTRPCGHRIISSAPQPPTYWYLTKIAASGGGCSIIADMSHRETCCARNLRPPIPTASNPSAAAASSGSAVASSTRVPCQLRLKAQKGGAPLLFSVTTAAITPLWHEIEQHVAV